MTSPTPPRAMYRMHEVAEMLAVHPDTVKKLIRQGDLAGAKRLGTSRRAPWLIPARSVDRFVKREYAGQTVPMDTEV